MFFFDIKKKSYSLLILKKYIKDDILIIEINASCGYFLSQAKFANIISWIKNEKKYKDINIYGIALFISQKYNKIL